MQNNINIRKYNACFLTVFILSVFSTYYLGKIYLPLWIISLCICSILFAFFIIHKGKIFSISQIVLPIIYIFFTLLSQFFLLDNKENQFSIFSILIPILFYILIISLAKKLSEKEIIYILKFIIIFSIPILLLEATYRISNPIYIIDGVDIRTLSSYFHFYSYKFNSILFEDSNFVGVMIVVLFSVVLYLEDLLKKKLLVLKLLLFIFVILTLSRASILVFIFMYILFYTKNLNYRPIKLLIIITGIMLGTIIFALSLKDDSFNTKLLMFNLFADYIHYTSPFNLLFGIGIGEHTSNEYSLMYHNVIFQHIMDEGILGFTLLFIFWLQTIRKSNYKNLFIFIPFIMLGMSVVGHTIAYFYVVISLIQTLESRKNQIAK